MQMRAERAARRDQIGSVRLTVDAGEKSGKMVFEHGRGHRDARHARLRRHLLEGHRRHRCRRGERAAARHERGHVPVPADAEQDRVEHRGRPGVEGRRERPGVAVGDRLGLDELDGRRMDARRGDPARPEQGLARQQDVAPRIVDRDAALVAPEPLDPIPGRVAALGERHHYTAATAATREGERGAATRRGSGAKRLGEERGRGGERLGIRLIDVDIHPIFIADRRRAGHVDARAARV